MQLSLCSVCFLSFQMMQYLGKKETLTESGEDFRALEAKNSRHNHHALPVLVRDPRRDRDRRPAGREFTYVDRLPPGRCGAHRSVHAVERVRRNRPQFVCLP